LLTEKFKIEPKGFIYLRCEPEISFERIQKRKRSGEENISLEYLKKLHRKHDDWLLNEKKTKVLVLDASTDFERNPEKFIQQVKEYFWYNIFV
jgi:deoxyadenosine/deoxycytidine kinase